MAVKIKLKRIGKMRSPHYRIVVADARTKRDGRAIEEIGLYHPMEDPSIMQVDSGRVQHWLSVGAQPTEPVLAILKVTGDWQRHKGLPGAEGTLRLAAPKADKKATFEAAARESIDHPADGATTPRVKKAPQKTTAQADDVAATIPDVPSDVPAAEAEKTPEATQGTPAAETPAEA